MPAAAATRTWSCPPSTFQSLVCFSANPGRDWTPAFASLDDPFGLLHKLVRASDLTVCLDRYCAPDSTRRRQVQAFEVGENSVGSSPFCFVQCSKCFLTSWQTYGIALAARFVV